MIVRRFVIAAGLVLLSVSIDGSKIPERNEIWGSKPPAKFEIHPGSLAGPEKVPLEIIDEDGIQRDERTREKTTGVENFPETELDEETIRKAEKIADEDLLNGLNRILENNETLEDVFRAENINEFL